MSKTKYFLARVIVGMAQRLDLLYSRIHICKLRGELKHLGREPTIENPAIFMNAGYISIGDHFTARSGAKIRAYTAYEDDRYEPSLVIGNNVHLATDCTINCIYRITIGDNSGLGAGSKVMDHAHGLPGYEDLLEPMIKRRLSSKGAVTIGPNCYIGAGVVIMAGVEIGENCIVGSNAVVNKSIPANSIAAGIPARVIRTIPVPTSATAVAQ